MEDRISESQAAQSPYPWTRNDAGRRTSTRSKQKNDCTVRAIALARNMPYDEAYDMLAEAGRKCAKGFDIMTWLDQHEWATKIPFPAKKGESRMNPVEFAKQFPNGTYICRVAKHVYCVVDGVVFDTHRSRPNRCIYTAWRIE
jgi:hypothetical protein